MRADYSRRLQSGRYLLTGAVNIDSVEIHFNVFDTKTKPEKMKMWYTPRRALHQQLGLPDLDDETVVDALKKQLDDRVDLVIGSDLGCSNISAQFAGLYGNYDISSEHGKRKLDTMLDDEVAETAANSQNNNHGLQMVFRQAEVDQPLVEYRNWLKGRKEICEVNISAVEAAIGKEYDPTVAVVLVSFYSDPTVKRRKSDSDRRRLAIMDRRADLEVDLPAKYFGLLDNKEYQPHAVVTMGQVNDRGWRQASRAQSKSYSTYAKVRIRHGRNVNRRVRVTRNLPDGKSMHNYIHVTILYHRQY